MDDVQLTDEIQTALVQSTMSSQSATAGREIACTKCGAAFIPQTRSRACLDCERVRKADQLRARRQDPAYDAAHRQRRRDIATRVRSKLKAETFAAYGGKCQCCGEAHLEFLGIDHVHGDGAKHRRSIGRGCGPEFYRWLRNQGYPKDGYRLLCWNCNLARGFHGQCPRERDRSYQRDQRSPDSASRG